MHQDHGARWRVLQGRFETLEVESDGARIIIRIFERGDANILEKRMMDDYSDDLSVASGDRYDNRLTPCGVAQKDLFRTVEVVKPAEEQRSKVIRSCSGDSLHTCNALLGNGRRVRTEDQFRSSRGKLGEPGDGQVFMVVQGVIQQSISRLPTTVVG